METISREKFTEKFMGSNPLLRDTIIKSDIHNILISNINLKSFTFKNCIFNCNVLEFRNIHEPTFELTFENCTFNGNVSFNRCQIDTLKFFNTKSIESLTINGDLFNPEEKFEIKSFWFSNIIEDKKNDPNKSKQNDEIILSASFNFNNILFKKYFEFNHINNVTGIFDFSNNIIGDEKFEKVNSCVFHSSHLSNVSFSDNVFKAYTSFKGSTFSFNKENFKNTGSHWYESKFERNEFNKVKFNEIEIVNYIKFDDCKFHSTTWFEKCKSLEESEITFIACKFEKYSLFDNSKFNKIGILHSTFREKASFKNFEANDFKIYQVTFGEVAYFDDLNKENETVIEYWDRETLRAIKRELINTHNQIDYLRFKAYELNAYKKEVNQNKLNWKDSLILYFNKDSNYFGLDWTKGLQFIIKWGFLFYFLYLLVYILQAKNKCLIPKQEDFYINYLKFLNPFSFLKSPIDDAENYFLPFLFFVLGKIFVSYGIYQTVQAFRKFGVNGG